MFGIRWGWLFPAMFVKAANIRVCVTGPSAELIGLPQPPFASQAFHFWGLRRLLDICASNVVRRAVSWQQEGFIFTYI